MTAVKTVPMPVTQVVAMALTIAVAAMDMAVLKQQEVQQVRLLHQVPLAQVVTVIAVIMAAVAAPAGMAAAAHIPAVAAEVLLPHKLWVELCQARLPIPVVISQAAAIVILLL